MRVRVPNWIKKLFPPVVWKIDTTEKVVYLTFDDGPTPGVTEYILSMLKRFGASATFFVLGKNVELYPDLYEKIVAAGHKIGNHTYSHQKGWGMPLERYIEDVALADDLVHSDLFRPPYARITPSQARAVSHYHKIIMWSIISRDYNYRLTGEEVLKEVIPHIEPGAIIVFHDSEKSFPNMSYALPYTLKYLTENGYKCKSIEL